MAHNQYHFCTLHFYTLSSQQAKINVESQKLEIIVHSYLIAYAGVEFQWIKAL